MKRLKEYYDSITDELIKGVYTHTHTHNKKKTGNFFLRKINTTMAQNNKGKY